MRFVKPKKALGQHFLNDIGVAERIVESLSPSQNVLEIGPGTGILTKILIKKKIIEIWCLAVASFFSGYLSFYFIKMLIISYKFQERSEGADEILIWIPQTSVALGSLIFFICVSHQLVLKIQTKKNSINFLDGNKKIDFDLFIAVFKFSIDRSPQPSKFLIFS